MILLSFDLEEFDLPDECGGIIDAGERISYSMRGTEKLLPLLDACGVKATFYTTAFFAVREPELMRRIAGEGHEIASHGLRHDVFEPLHLSESRKILEETVGVKVEGFRMPRMTPVAAADLRSAGYAYDSSINPTFLPGRYNNFRAPRTLFQSEGLWRLPASVTPLARIPLFWLSFRNLPQALYRRLAWRTYEHDGYLNLYFHPWEFMPIGAEKRFRIPLHVRNNCGQPMYNRLKSFILHAEKRGCTFGTTSEFLSNK
jgi:peptidoglycan/xylan/chitin deacetylase (PgdA/CDA1 family)